jgi:hypothetical protein
LTGDEDESEEDEEDPVDHAQPPRGPRHRVSTFYSHPNITGDIVESEWSFVGAPLHRGGNNRRRQSLRRRHAEGADDTVTLGSHLTPAMIPPSVAMNPTNPRHVQRQPSIVLSSGTRRPRSSRTSGRDEVYEQDGYEDDEIVEYKRRRVSISSRNAGRPAYMVHATPNNPNMTVPTSFNEPPSDSFLDLTIGTTGRPLIKFFDNPNLTETDNDACNLHTGIPIDRACGVHYFEVECIDQGKEGFMSVGWTIAGTSPDRLVGWDKGTWGWHADDGMCFNQSGSGSESAAKWGCEYWLSSIWAELMCSGRYCWVWNRLYYRSCVLDKEWRDDRCVPYLQTESTLINRPSIQRLGQERLVSRDRSTIRW